MKKQTNKQKLQQSSNVLRCDPNNNSQTGLGIND